MEKREGKMRSEKAKVGRERNMEKIKTMKCTNRDKGRFRKVEKKKD